MTKFTFLAALALAVPLTLATQATTPATAQAAPTGDLARVQQHLQAMETLRAQFRQTDRNGQILTGSLTLKRPGRIRFQYQEGVPLLIVADGRSLNMIDYEVRQVQRWPIRNSPMAVLIDPAANLLRYARLLPGDTADTISVDVRDPRRPEYGTITMVFQRDAGTPAGLRLYGWVAIDAQDHRTTIRLSNHRYNQPVADSAFRWRDPRPNTRNR
jgi:outer membrane lipoprotein-sorting protein